MRTRAIYRTYQHRVRAQERDEKKPSLPPVTGGAWTWNAAGEITWNDAQEIVQN